MNATNSAPFGLTGPSVPAEILRPRESWAGKPPTTHRDEADGAFQQKFCELRRTRERLVESRSAAA